MSNNNNKFYICEHCGNLVGMINDAGVPMMCCGQKMKLLEFDTEKKRALGSIKKVLVEENKAREDAVWATLEVGQHYTGTVKNLTAYGAFVDIGGVDQPQELPR